MKKSPSNVPVLPNVNNTNLIRPVSVENGLHNKNASLASSSTNSVSNNQASASKSEFKTNFHSHSSYTIDIKKQTEKEKGKSEQNEDFGLFVSKIDHNTTENKYTGAFGQNNSQNFQNNKPLIRKKVT